MGYDMKNALAISIMALAITACSNNDNTTSNNIDSVESETTTEQVDTKVDTNSPAEIIQAFKDAGLPVGKVVVHTSASDPNKLLGRPDGYIASAHFEDNNVEQDMPIDGEDALPKGGSIEVWKTPEEAQARKNYIEEVVKQMNMPALKQYMYLKDEVLLRLEYDIIPEQADKYNQVLQSL